MAELLICHFEDEPSKVDFPGMIEVALYQHEGILNTSIEDVDDEGQRFNIIFTTTDREFTIQYAIGESIKDLEERNRFKVESSRLHLIDMSINGNENAGVKIAQQLIERGVAKSKIWMVTAYEMKARVNPRLRDVRIYPKPSPFAEMTSEILKMILPEGSA